MSEKPDKNQVPGKPAQAGLSRPLQEHLGQQLRTTYDAAVEKPAFLGDPALPPHLDDHVRRLEATETLRERGVKAVEKALKDIKDPKNLRAQPDGSVEPPRDGVAPKSGSE